MCRFLANCSTRDLFEPTLHFEPYQHPEGDSQHYSPYPEISPVPGEFRHIVEVHAVNTDDEGQGDKNGGHDGKGLHDGIHPIGV